MATKKAPPPGSIAVNRKARHNYQIEETFEAGIALEGWEVKSLRAGRAQVADAYVVFRKNEAWLLNSHFTPLVSASTHVNANPTRSRKLLLHRKQINQLMGQVERAGYTVVPLKLYWKKQHVKVEIGLAKGKHLYDKRSDTKQRDWERQKQRILKRQ